MAIKTIRVNYGTPGVTSEGTSSYQYDHTSTSFTIKTRSSIYSDARRIAYINLTEILGHSNYNLKSITFNFTARLSGSNPSKPFCGCNASNSDVMEFNTLTNGQSVTISQKFDASEFYYREDSSYTGYMVKIGATNEGKDSYVYFSNVSFDVEYEVIEYVTISTSVTPAGAGTVTPATQQVESGTTAAVTATPNAGYKFSHWLLDGADSGITTTTLSGTVTSNLLCTAVFVLDKINKVLLDTGKPTKIVIDTQEVKAVYIDKTKVFG